MFDVRNTNYTSKLPAPKSQRKLRGFIKHAFIFCEYPRDRHKHQKYKRDENEAEGFAGEASDHSIPPNIAPRGAALPDFKLILAVVVMVGLVAFKEPKREILFSICGV